MEKEINQTGIRLAGRISYSEDEVSQALDQELRTRAVNVLIPGFRRGKAPLKLVENLLGRDVLLDRAIDRLVNEGIQKVISEYKVTPVDIKDVEFIEKGDGKALIFSFTIETYPKVEVDNYEELISELTWEEPKVDDKSVDEVIENIRHRLGVWKTVEDKNIIERGDYVLVDIKDDPSKPFDENKEIGSIIKLGEGILSPGDDESLIGAEIGSTHEIKSRFPEDYSDKSFRGKEVTLYILIKGIKMLDLPPLDDDFAKRFNYPTLEAMRNGLREGIYKERLAQMEHKLGQEIKDKLAQAVDTEIPDIMVRDLLKEWKRILYQDKNAPKDFEETNYQYALNEIKATLALRYIGEKEGLESPEEKVDNLIKLWKVKNITEDIIEQAKVKVIEDEALKFLVNSIKERKQ
jgi:trigger factor